VKLNYFEAAAQFGLLRRTMQYRGKVSDFSHKRFPGTAGSRCLLGEVAAPKLTPIPQQLLRNPDSVA
jgi:hypothetical protein